MADNWQCARRGPQSRGRCSKFWSNEHTAHHSLETGERWTDEDAERIREEKREARKGTVAIWDLVIADAKERDRVGAEHYGQRLTAGTPIDSLREAYEEALDLACYLRKALLERGGK